MLVSGHSGIPLSFSKGSIKYLRSINQQFCCKPTGELVNALVGDMCCGGCRLVTFDVVQAIAAAGENR